jgi:hypothetical protein
LGIFDGRGGSDIQTTVEFIYTMYRTDLAALPATRTYIRVNISRMINERGLKMSRFTIKGFNLCVGNDIYIKMPADLDQFGRDNSHGTVVSWKGLIQLRHHTPNSR